MYHPRSFIRASFIMFAAALLATAGLCQAGGSHEIANITAGQQTLQFHPTVSHDHCVLSIAGPDGFVVRQEFAAGEQPVFQNMGSLPDGSYRYELRLTPKIAPEAMAELAAAREAGNEEEVATDLRSKGLLPDRAMTAQGAFAVEKGRFVYAPPGLVSATDSDSAAKDVLHYDDVIITGSLCVGWDCANGESFGYDTVKLKENNLRLFFEDTSIGSFPSGDWRIRINDTTSGGASYFAVEDGTNARTPFRIETGAPTHALYVEDYGRVGLGTSIPYVELHIVDGDSPTIRLDQDGSSGWVAQRWDLCGNETNFFIRDVTNGSKLCFRIQPNTPSNTLSLRSTGYVGIGTWSPAKKLEIEDDGPAFRLDNIGSGGGIWDFKVNGSNGRLNITDDSAATRVPIKVDPGADNNLLRIGVVASDQIDIDGDLVVTGSITPDYVFDSSYQLESIEEHAAFMWQERHLPAVAPATPAGNGKHQINVGNRAQGVLEELEKAHIYIEQLNNTVKSLANENALLKQRLAAIEARLQ